MQAIEVGEIVDDLNISCNTKNKRKQCVRTQPEMPLYYTRIYHDSNASVMRSIYAATNAFYTVLSASPRT